MDWLDIVPSLHVAQPFNGTQTPRYPRTEHNKTPLTVERRHQMLNQGWVSGTMSPQWVYEELKVYRLWNMGPLERPDI